MSAIDDLRSVYETEKEMGWRENPIPRPLILKTTARTKENIPITINAWWKDEEGK